MILSIHGRRSAHGGELYLCEHRCSHDWLPVQRLLQMVSVLRVRKIIRTKTDRQCKKKKQPSKVREQFYLRLGVRGQKKWRGYCHSCRCESDRHFLSLQECCIIIEGHLHWRWGGGLLLSRGGRWSHSCFTELLWGKRWARQQSFRGDLIGGWRWELHCWCLSGCGMGWRVISLLWGNSGTRWRS